MCTPHLRVGWEAAGEAAAPEAVLTTGETARRRPRCLCEQMGALWPVGFRRCREWVRPEVHRPKWPLRRAVVGRGGRCSELWWAEALPWGLGPLSACCATSAASSAYLRAWTASRV